VDDPSPRSFARRVARAVLIVLVGLALAAFLVVEGGVFLLLFSGVLFGVVLHSLAELVRRGLHVGYRVALVLVTTALCVLTGLGLWVLYTRVAAQLGDLAQQLPRAVSSLLREVQQNPVYKRFFGGATTQSLKPSPQALLQGTRGVASGLADFLAGAAVVFFIGLFGAWEPDLYARGAARLVPPRHRDVVRGLLAELDVSLFRWLVGRFIAMAAVGVVVGVGLMIITVPLPLALAVVAGLLTFIPYLGAIVSAVPALILAVPIGWGHVLAVVGVYAVAHFVEGYLLAPIVARRTVEFPPAFTLATQVILGAVWGLAGLTLANPVTVVIVLAVQRLYVEPLEAREADRVVAPERAVPPPPPD
jgi:predicted PurR-regulated permease PerM